MAYKWNLLLRALGIRASFWHLYQLYMVAPTVGNFISGVGSELFRAYGVTKDRSAVKAVLASIVIERALGLFAMLILVLVGISLATYQLTDRFAILSHLWWVPVLSCLILVIISLIFFRFMGSVETWDSRISKLLIIKQLTADIRNGSPVSVSLSHPSCRIWMDFAATAFSHLHELSTSSLPQCECFNFGVNSHSTFHRTGDTVADFF